jgi:prolyl 4-hydroxylase
MVLYENHSVLHGRPFPLKGRFFANVFVHFEPIGPVDGPDDYSGDLPPYVIPGSPEEPHWRSKFPDGHQLMKRETFATGSTEAHRHATAGNLDDLRQVLDKQPEVINRRDVNGWTPLHEAVRRGSYEHVELLLDRGAEVNARTGKHQDGESPVVMAARFHGEDNNITTLLRERGGVEHHPQQEL